MNTRIVLAIAISAGMALLVTGVFYQMAVRGDSAANTPVGMSEIVVAVRDLEVGSQIQITDLRLQEWPTSNVPEGAFEVLEDVVERSPMAQVLADEPVLNRRLAPPGSGFGLSPKVPEGMRAMSVRVDDVSGLAGFVMPEAKVDVLITGTPSSSATGGQITRTILSNVRVLSAGEHLTPDATGRPQKVPVVTLLLEPEQAEMVTLAQARGRIQLVLRNAKDEKIAQTSGVNESELYGVRGPSQEPRADRQAPVAYVPAPPPPPEIEVQMIRGNKVSVQSFSQPELN